MSTRTLTVAGVQLVVPDEAPPGTRITFVVQLGKFDVVARPCPHGATHWVPEGQGDQPECRCG